MSQHLLYRHAQLLAPKRSNPEEARMISRLADKAQALAEEYGETLDRKAALARARENLAYVKAMAKGVSESEWML